MATKGITLLMVLVLAGCCCLPQRCDTHPCWYDESKGPGVPYYDPNEPVPWKRTYYLGRDPTNLNRVIRLYASGGYTPYSYSYHPSPERWTAVWRWNTIRPYVIPRCPKK